MVLAIIRVKRHYSPYEYGSCLGHAIHLEQEGQNQALLHGEQAFRKLGNITLYNYKVDVKNTVMWA